MTDLFKNILTTVVNVSLNLCSFMFICVVASSKVEENFTSSAALTEVAAAIY